MGKVRLSQAPLRLHLPLTQALRQWQHLATWSAQRVEQLVASGQTVFVDFTAAWCVTCQVNKNPLTRRCRKICGPKRAWCCYRRRLDAPRQRHHSRFGATGRSGCPVYLLSGR